MLISNIQTLSCKFLILPQPSFQATSSVTVQRDAFEPLVSALHTPPGQEKYFRILHLSPLNLSPTSLNAFTSSLNMDDFGEKNNDQEKLWEIRINSLYLANAINLCPLL